MLITSHDKRMLVNTRYIIQFGMSTIEYEKGWQVWCECEQENGVVLGWLPTKEAAMEWLENLKNEVNNNVNT